MPTFLELAQKVGSESGTVDSGRLTTVVDAQARLAKVVRWTNDAYRQIQNAATGWFWLQGEFSAPLTIGQQRHTPDNLGIDRFAAWDCRGPGREDRFSVYLTAGAGAGEYGLAFVDWPTFYTTRLRGLQLAGQPRLFSISPAGEFVVSPTPDAAYTLRGPYRKAPQELAVDADVPEMPARFHDVIVSAALVMLTTHDEAAPTLSLYQMRQLRGFSELLRDQLPVIEFGGGPFA